MSSTSDRTDRDAVGQSIVNLSTGSAPAAATTFTCVLGSRTSRRHWKVGGNNARGRRWSRCLGQR